MTTKLYNLTDLKQKRRDLRKNQPSPELLVWNAIRNRQIGGYKFKRQYSIGSFILDFYCAEMKLAIEIDGDSHYEQGAPTKDHYRQASIEKLGVKFLRFTNLEVTSNLEGIVEAIEAQLPHPNPLLSKERVSKV